MHVITRARGAAALVLAAVYLGASPAPAQEAARDTTVPSPGLWMAKQRFGPDVRGRLLLFREGNAWRAEIAGHRVAARAAADTISFTLPDSLGSFRGRLSRDQRSLAGHWVQPSTVMSGSQYASPLRLHTDGANRWMGDVVPLEDELTLFLRITRRPDGTFGAFLRNPERNLGRQLRIDRIERHGAEVTAVGKFNGAGQERVCSPAPDSPSTSMGVERSSSIVWATGNTATSIRAAGPQAATAIVRRRGSTTDGRLGPWSRSGSRLIPSARSCAR